MVGLSGFMRMRANYYETKKNPTVIIMRQPDSCDILPDRDFPSRSHNICYDTISKYYETAAGNAILQKLV